MENREIVETTLGELIVALTEEAAAILPDEKKCYELVAYILWDLLCSSALAPRIWH